MKAIQKELGDEEDRDEFSEMEAKMRRPGSRRRHARRRRTGSRLRQMSPMSPESTVVRNYLDWLLSIPWAKRSRIKKDLKLARRFST